MPSVRLSNHARAVVRAFDLGYRVQTTGEVITPGGEVLGGRPNRRHPRLPAYLCFTLRTRDIRTRVCVHKLAAFQKFGVRALAPGVHVRHLDGNPQNNALDNLAIGSASDNRNDIPGDVRRQSALKAAKARRKLSEAQARELVMLKQQGWLQKDLAQRFGVYKSTISEILSGRLYSEATGLPRKERQAQQPKGAAS